MPKFSTYQTYYEIFCKYRPRTNGWKKTFSEFYEHAHERIPEAIRTCGESSVKSKLSGLLAYSGNAQQRLKLKEAEASVGENCVHQISNLIEWNWYQLGRPTFKIWPGMLDALAHTSIDIETERFNVPFPVFKIDFPTNNTLGEACDRPHIDGMLVYDGSPTFTVQGKPGDPIDQMGRTLFVKWFSVSDLTDKEPGLLQEFIELDALFFAHQSPFYILHIEEGLTIKECLEKSATISERTGWDKLQKHLLSIAVATALISTSDDKRLIRPERRSVRYSLSSAKRKKQGDVSAGMRKGWDVGPDIKLPKDYSKIVRANLVDGEAARLKFGHIRSGHLRLQPFGNRDAPDYKVIFISPMVIRSDLPMKPKLTQRAIKRG